VHGVFPRRAEEARQIERRFRQSADKNVSGTAFKRVASALWPLKTAAQLASIAGKDERTAARWLSGESDPPGILIAAIINEITRPD
jgi:hypothetical protein